MSQSASEPSVGARASTGGGLSRFVRATEVDTRMLGMVGALLVIWLVFHVLSGGIFLTPRNLWNLTVQTSSIAVMATGMVLVIVTRNIDLSVGSILGFTGMVMAALQANILPGMLGFDSPFTWLLDPRRRHPRRRRDRRPAGLHHRLHGRAGLHRHAGRPADLARRRLVADLGPHRRPARRHLPADGRRRHRLDRRDLELDPRRPRLPRRHRLAGHRPQAPRCASASRCDRSGRR